MSKTFWAAIGATLALVGTSALGSPIKRASASARISTGVPLRALLSQGSRTYMRGRGAIYSAGNYDLSLHGSGLPPTDGSPLELSVRIGSATFLFDVRVRPR
jgi:hypothetical protein